MPDFYAFKKQKILSDKAAVVEKIQSARPFVLPGGQRFGLPGVVFGGAVACWVGDLTSLEDGLSGKYLGLKEARLSF